MINKWNEKREKIVWIICLRSREMTFVENWRKINQKISGWNNDIEVMYLMLCSPKHLIMAETKDQAHN